MLDAFAQRENVRVRSDHLVADHDAPLDMQARIHGKPGFGADARRHHHDIGAIGGAIVEHHRFHRVLAQNGFRLRLAVNLYAARLEITLQQIAGGRIELTVHDMAGDVQYDHLHAAQSQGGGGFEAKQATADNDRPCIGALRRLDHGIDVIEIAERHDPRQILAGQGDDERRRAGGDDQLVIRRFAMARDHHFALAVDRRHRFTETRADPMRRVPGSVVGDDLLIGFLAAEDGRQHQPIIIAARLGAEQGHIEAAMRLFEDMFERATRGHAGADDHQPFGTRSRGEGFGGEHVHLFALTPLPRSGDARRGI